MANSPLLLLNLGYIFGIGLNIVLLRFLSLHFAPLNNNGIRFLAGGIILLFFISLKYRSALYQIFTNLKYLITAIVVGMMLAANMYFWLKGTALTNAVTASLFGVLAMPVGVLVAALFFQDERQKIQSRAFWLGSLLTILGSLGFVWQGESQSLSEGAMLGSLFLFFSITIRNIQNLMVKFAKSANVFAFSCFTSFSSSITSLLISQQNSTLSELNHSSSGLLFLLIGAGIYAVFAAMVLAFHIIQTQGLVTYQILELLIPIATALVAYFILGEQITLMQIGFATIVIFGASLALGVIKVQNVLK